MTPAEEDAILAKAKVDATENYGRISAWLSWADAIRLAIRAAVAHERERAAKVCESHEPKSFTTDGMITRAMCAAAIRRGE